MVSGLRNLGFGRFVPFDVSVRERSRRFKSNKRRLVFLQGGSFVRYLVENHGLKKFMTVYEGGTFEGVYGKSIVELEAAWQAMIRRLGNSGDKRGSPPGTKQPHRV